MLQAILWGAEKFMMGVATTTISVVATTTTPVENNSLRILFVGDIFLDRHIDTLTQKDNKRIEKENLTRKPALPLYTYPFSGLGTLDREKYDTWVGNLECPVTVAQTKMIEKERDLRFSCRPEYLPELKKYFDIVSLGNNHTDNMGEKGFSETKTHLEKNSIKYFGHYDPEKLENCKVLNVKNKSGNIFPIAFCGYHGAYKLPTDRDLNEIKKYSKYFFTIVYPHQGEEYKESGNTYQKKIYRKMIDNGADLVIGSHPHVIANVEVYKGKSIASEHLYSNEGKGKYIFYSLGNFIFDQSWIKTRQHLTLDTTLTFPANTNIFAVMDCEIDEDACIELAKKRGYKKATTTINIKPIFTSAEKDFITKKMDLTEKEYNQKLKKIGFTKL